MKINSKTTLDEMEALQELAQKIGSEDFSKASHKEAVRKKVLNNIREKEGDRMKKSQRFKKPAVAVASIALGVTLFAQTAIAQEFTQKIKEIFSIAGGNINIIQEEPVERPDGVPVPENLKGQIFDSEGNEVKVFTDSLKEIYTQSGEKIAYLTNGENNESVIVTEAQEAAEKNETTLTLTDANKRNEYTCFDVKLPEYLPDGYKFDRIELYKDENGKVENSKYISIYYTNESTGEYMPMQQRFSDEETGYTTGTDGTVEQVQVNGVEALIMDDRSIDWEANGVLYSISGRGAFGKDELLKIAESIK